MIRVTRATLVSEGDLPNISFGVEEPHLPRYEGDGLAYNMQIDITATLSAVSHDTHNYYASRKPLYSQ